MPTNEVRYEEALEDWSDSLALASFLDEWQQEGTGPASRVHVLPDPHPPGSSSILSPLQRAVAGRGRSSPELTTLPEYSVAQTLRQGRQAAPSKEPSGTLLGKMCPFSGVSTSPAGSRDGKKLWSPGDCPWKCGVRELGENISVSRL